MKELIQHIKNSILNEQWKSYVIFSGGTYVIVENFKRDFSLKNYTLEYMKNNVSEFMDSAGFDIVRLWECDDFVAHLSGTNIFVYIEGSEYGGMFGGDMDVMLQARTILADDLQQQEIIHIEDKMQGDVIDFYRVHDKYGEFSNFARFPIQLKRKTWPTSEHYFQAQKFVGTAHEETVRTAKNAWWAAKYGRELASLPNDWDERRLEVMTDAVKAKFKQHPPLKKLLLDTGNAILIEKTKQDNFWADGGDGSGQNFLGKILMMVREELKQPKHQNNTATPRLLFLDDLRNPADCLHYMDDRKNVDVSIYRKEWHIVRTYNAFVKWIEAHGLPDFISFDHDLADFDDDNMMEHSGMDCAKWLVEYCLDHKLPCPDFAVHSANPAGADNITALLNNFKRMAEHE